MHWNNLIRQVRNVAPRLFSLKPFTLLLQQRPGLSGWLLTRNLEQPQKFWTLKMVRRLVGVEPDITLTGKLTRYSTRDIDIWVGDIFDLTAVDMGLIHAIYDRAALVALPADIRKQYTSHLTCMTRSAPQLLITYEYDQSKIDGPPFSVSAEEVKQHYGDTFELELVESQEIHGGLKEKIAATETVWLLHNTNRR